MCGFLHSDQRFGPLLDAMPALTCIRVRDGAIRLEAFTDVGRYAEPVRLDQDPHWWTAAIDHLVSETAKPGPGNRAVLARLSELLFTELVRWQLSYISEGHGGWLAGLNDAHVGRALSLLHAEPARPGRWRCWHGKPEYHVRRLAGASLSWSATRPCNTWRTGECMWRGDNCVKAAGLGEIAARVGYESEAAFSRAFRRLVGVPPASWRQSNMASPELQAGGPR